MKLYGLLAACCALSVTMAYADSGKSSGSQMGAGEVFHDVGIAYQAKFDTPVSIQLLQSIESTKEFREAVSIANSKAAMYEKCRAKTPAEIPKVCPEIGAADKKYLTLVTKQLISKMTVSSSN